MSEEKIEVEAEIVAEVELTVQQQIEKSMIAIFSKMAQERAESEKNMMLNFSKMLQDNMAIMYKKSDKKLEANRQASAIIEEDVKSAIIEAVVILEPSVDEIIILETFASFAETIAVENSKAIYDALKTCNSSPHRSNLVKPMFTTECDSISNMLKGFYAFLFDGINGLMSFEIGVERFIFDPGGMCKEFKDFSRLGLSLRALDICCLTNRF